MIDDAKRFLTDWITENVNAEPYEPEGDRTRARELAAECQVDAEDEGISVIVLDAAVRNMIGGAGTLTELIANALKSAADAEVQRLVDKDDA